MSGILSKVEGIGNTVVAKGKGILDSVLSPEKRAELITRAQQWIVKNPKLSAFLLTNIALTGPPLFLFILFTITVAIFAIIVALVVALLAAVLFILFCVGVALLFLLPTVFFTTLVAVFLFLWGMGGYYLLKWLNSGDGPTPEGSALGDKLNSLTGGRLDFIMGPMHEAANNGGELKNPPTNAGGDNKSNGSTSKDDKSNGSASKPDNKSNGSSTGADIAKKGGDGLKKNANVGSATNKVSKNANVDSVTNKTGVNGAAKQAHLDGVTNKAGTASGAAKGGVGGTTGLA